MWKVAELLPPADGVALAVARCDRAAAGGQLEDLAREAGAMAAELFRVIDLQTHELRRAYAAAMGYVCEKTQADEYCFMRGYPSLVDAALTAYFYDTPGEESRLSAGMSFYPRQQHHVEGFHSGVDISAHSVCADRNFPAELAVAVMRAAQSGIKPPPTAHPV